MTSPTTTTRIERAVADVLAARASMPDVRATYRLQFNHTFTFTDALPLVPYLASLGVSHLYASPLFTAAPGSMHGYDVVDYAALNPEIGTREEFDRLVQALHQHEMGLIIDFVPNHMGIEKGANAWWQNVLENGRMSPFAEFFDIDWTPLKRELQGKVLLPFLGAQYGEVLEAGDLHLRYDRGRFTVHYWDTPFPIDPQTYPSVLGPLLVDLRSQLDTEDLDLLELESVAAAFDRLPAASADEPAPEAIEERHREQLVTCRRLAELVERNGVIAEALDSAVAAINGTTGESASFDALDRLLCAQPYRLSFWRVASEEINYRRFFAINTLAAIRQEEREVFAATHNLLLDLLVDGAVDGVRFDHPDGLWDPERYFHDVQVAFVQRAVRRNLAPATDDEWRDMLPQVTSAIVAALERIRAESGPWPVWTVGEKILEHGEDLPATWKTAGTVGYEFMQAATGVLVNPASRSLFDTMFSRFTGERIRFPELVYDMKRMQVTESFASELNVLTNVANRISESDRHSRDFTFNNLRQALREVIANFGVYRTYTTCREHDVTERDAAYIHAAVDEAIRRNPRLDRTVFEFLRSALLLHHTGEARERRFAPCHFAMKMQQLSGPVMAKGLEDTAFYRFNRLTSLNEVGGDPARFGCSVGDFHRQNQARLAQWPRSMVNSSTHDTKRSEDVRAHISVLSERPTEFRAAINRWTRLNRKFKVKQDGALAPNKSDEWFVYQTLIGAWPLAGRSGINPTFIARIQDYLIKVVRESGVSSNWVAPNEPYESALRDFIAGMLNRRRATSFIHDLEAFVAAQRDAGLANALAQQVLKLTSPGVPDIYQGTELWDDSLVDPDNRRPVDYDLRQHLIAQNPAMPAAVAQRATGAIKLQITRRILAHRAQHPALFLHGEYLPLRISGPASDHLVAFLRRHGDDALLVIVPRLMYVLAGTQPVFTNPDLWRDIAVSLPAGFGKAAWRSVLDDREIADPTDLATLFADAPVAVLSTGGDRA